MNTERQEIEAMTSTPKEKTYKLNWSDGTYTIACGTSASNAFKNEGYGEIHLSNLRNYEVIN